MKIENLINCTGCHACFSACPKSSISMQSNYEGFLFPVINKELCVECGLCEKVCPVISYKSNKITNRKCFAAVNTNDAVRLSSSSGGMFTILAEKVIDEGGVVFGAKFTEDFNLVHSWTDNKEQISEFRGAKYFQSVIGDSYKECKKFLDSGRKILYIGTPCQIAGLQSFLRKLYDNLLLAEIVCHGVPSKLLWDTYKDYISKNTDSNLKSFSFRNKTEGWLNYKLFATFDNNKSYSANHEKDLFMNLNLSNNCLRNSCYTCQFKNNNSLADLTLGDFWGINKIKPELFDNKGTSLVIVNTLKGENFVSNLSDCDIHELQLEDCIIFNPSVVHAAKKGEYRNSFYKMLNSTSFPKFAKKYGVKKDFRYYLRVMKRGIKKWIIH